MKLYLFLFLLFLSALSFGEESISRWIDLEWDEVENAKGYDISLTELIDGKEYSRGQFHTETSHWSKEEPPGKYLVRIRALDSRKVPGPWGEPIPFTIQYENPLLISPLDKFSFIKDENKNNKIVFTWSAIKGAKDYNFILTDKEHNILIKTKVNTNSYTYSTSKIGTYYWSVQTSTEASDKVSRDNLKYFEFNLKGEELKSPILDFSLNDSRGIIINWKEISRATSYTCSIVSLEKENTSPLTSWTTKKNAIGISQEKIPNGKWFISIKSQAENYQESKDSRIIFKTNLGKTELVSNESSIFEQNFRRLNSSKISFSIGYPSSTYTNKNYEVDTQNTENLRGLFININSSQAFAERFNIFSILNYSQIANNYTLLKTINIKEQLRYVFGNRFLNLQPGIGINFKSLPNLYSNRLITPKKVNTDDYKTLGITASLQINKKWNENFENEIYFDFTQSFMRIEAANTFVKSNDLTFNIKSMYNINSQFNINLNYFISKLNNRNKAAINANSYAIEGDINSSTHTINTIMFGSELFY